MKTETVFKKGQKVFDHQFGWGEVVNIEGNAIFPIYVKYESIEMYYNRGGCVFDTDKPTLSFTEYTLEGFSQEPPIDYNECIGKLGVFWDENKSRRVIDELSSYTSGTPCLFRHRNSLGYENFKPLTEEQIKILGL